MLPLHQNPRFRQIVSDLEQDRRVERLRRRVKRIPGIRRAGEDCGRISAGVLRESVLHRPALLGIQCNERPG
jgi:hypothetical protein